MKWIKFLFVVLFKLCTFFLLGVGRLFGMSYQKISVIFNLYIQGTMLALSGLLPFGAGLYVACTTPTTWHITLCLIGLMYGSMYVTGLYVMFKHYPPEWNASFNLCVADLQLLSACLHIPYFLLNLIIFVMWWLAMLVVNGYYSYLLLV